MKRIMAALTALVLVLSFAACGKTAEDTTITGMVTAINGTVISLMEMDDSMGRKDFNDSDRPTRPDNMEGFKGFENMEGFEDGQFPWGEGEMPEFAEGEMPERPEGGERPNLPTGEDGEMQWPTGEDGNFQWGEGEMPNFGNFEYDGETTEIDIGSAHISMEEDGVKASGSLSDIKVGSFVTITRNTKGEVTNLLITSGMSGMGGFGNFGGFGGRGEKPTKGADSE